MARPRNWVRGLAPRKPRGRPTGKSLKSIMRERALLKCALRVFEEHPDWPLKSRSVEIHLMLTKLFGKSSGYGKVQTPETIRRYLTAVFSRKKTI
jgi:hypothetical protein